MDHVWGRDLDHEEAATFWGRRTSLSSESEAERVRRAIAIGRGRGDDVPIPPPPRDLIARPAAVVVMSTGAIFLFGISIGVAIAFVVVVAIFASINLAITFRRRVYRDAVIAMHACRCPCCAYALVPRDEDRLTPACPECGLAYPQVPPRWERTK